jgi:uncharacterized protein (DUF1778 family)
MPASPARTQRSARFNLRVSEREARLIRMGADRRGVSITNFIVESARVQAENEIVDARHFTLDAKTWRKFCELLDRPAREKPRLKRLFAEPSILERR